jgi:hypothetical protein
MPLGRRSARRPRFRAPGNYATAAGPGICWGRRPMAREVRARDEWAWSDRCITLSPEGSPAGWRATSSAGRLAAEPPVTSTPAVPVGIPSHVRNRSMTSSSTWVAPAASAVTASCTRHHVWKLMMIPPRPAACSRRAARFTRRQSPAAPPCRQNLPVFTPTRTLTVVPKRASSSPLSTAISWRSPAAVRAPQRVVLVQHRDAEDSHHRIPDKLLTAPP